MNLVKRSSHQPKHSDPFFDALFGSWFTPALASRRSRDNSAMLSPNVDVTESDTEYVLEAELPGVDKDNLSVSLEGDYLIIEASREEKTEEENGKTYYKEIRSGSFRRTFHLPESVERDPEKVAASYKDGILRLTLPKVEEVKKLEEKNVKIDFE